MKRYGQPKGDCVMDRPPTKQSIWFCERWISLRSIARSQGISVVYVHYLINGERRNLNAILKVCNAIGVTVDEFLEGVEIRKRQKLEQANVFINSYNNRVMAEITENVLRKKAGRPPLIPLPGFRLKQG